MSIKKGDKITIEYIGTLDDGTIFDQSENHDELLTFEVGMNQVIEGFDNAVIGMNLEEEKKFRIEPPEAYGEYNKNLVKQISRSQLPKEEDPKVGMVVVLVSKDGQKSHAPITEVTEENILIDLNHPLAGEALNFSIKIKEIISD
ncbi:MAG: peptidylprolyl isomerase [Candidatus Heimdallarchaeota archaeon]|nr:MAG: peptidylprolyl isomerase [Candidatus Heimdallarchaeota archaeon]